MYQLRYTPGMSGIKRLAVYDDGKLADRFRWCNLRVHKVIGGLLPQCDDLPNGKQMLPACSGKICLASLAFGEEVLCSANGNVEFDSGEPFNSVASQIMEVAQTDRSQIVWK